MPFKEVMNLRKSGCLDEALRLAQDFFDDAPDDLWAKRALAWVHYDYAKQYSLQNNAIMFLKAVSNIGALQLPGYDVLVFDNLAWQIGKFIFHLDVDASAAANYCDQLFDALRMMHFTRPADAYSFLFKAFHKRRQEWNRYLDFCDWWGFDNFQPSDYQPFVAESKQKIMSVVEQAHIGYAAALLSQQDTSRMDLFVPRLQRLQNEHKEYQYPAYYLSKILIALGRLEEAAQVLRPFVRSKPNDFWVWQLLGDTSSDSDTTFACYCKALLCPCKSQMLVKIKELFARMLYQRGLFDASKTEIRQVLGLRAENGWRPSRYLDQAQSETWYKDAIDLNDNTALYRQYAYAAESLIYDNCRSEEIVITSVNVQKKTARFATLSLANGVFRYSSRLKSPPKVGDVFTARFSDFKEGSNCAVLSIIPCRSPETVWADNMLSFEGVIHIPVGKNFGIVHGDNQVFVPPYLIGNHKNEGHVKGVAVKSFDKLKNREGWTALKMTGS